MNARAQGRRRRPLSELLYIQPASIRKSERFAELVAMLNESTALRRVRLEVRAWKLLDEPRLRIENLVNFCHTYRVPQHPFFAAFLGCKWSWRKAKADREEARRRFITDMMESVAATPKAMITWLADFEAVSDRSIPLWRERFQVRTKKRASELARLDPSAWMALFAIHLDELAKRYPGSRLLAVSTLLDLMMLESLPDPRTLKAPPRDALRSSWRRLSRLHHPDAGGDGVYFRLVDQARKRLGV